MLRLGRHIHYSAATSSGRCRAWRTSSSFTPSPCESVTIPCHSKGSIDLSIHHPLVGPAYPPGPPTIIIYLPRGPFLATTPEHDHDAPNISILQSILPYPIVRIHYRLSRANQYPTPIHDVLTGYDWIHAHLLPERAVSRAGRATHHGRVAVCGELIGGGLAATMALTECRSRQPGVVVAGLSNPIVDWVDLDDLVEPDHPESLTSKSPLTSLLQLRDQLFRKPEQYFDPFASPILFFRSTGKPVPPPRKTPQDDFEILAMLNQEEFYREQNALSRISGASPLTPPASPSTSNQDRVVPRRASRRFPSAASKLKLPRFNISAGRDLFVKDQAAELIYRLRQSFARQDKKLSGSKVLTEVEMDHLADEDPQSQAHRDAELERRANLSLHDGTAVWDGSSQGRARVMEMAGWLKEQLQ